MPALAVASMPVLTAVAGTAALSTAGAAEASFMALEAVVLARPPLHDAGVWLSDLLAAAEEGQLRAVR